MTKTIVTIVGDANGDSCERVVETDVLQLMAAEVEACNIEKGWYDAGTQVNEFMKDLNHIGLTWMPEELDSIRGLVDAYFGRRTFGDDMALLHSEVSEMLEAYRDHGTLDVTNGIHSDVPMKPEGIGSEAADVLVRLMDTCERYDIDLFAEWRRKVNFNWTRPVRHGGKKL